LQVQNYPQAVAARTWIGKRYESNADGRSSALREQFTSTARRRHCLALAGAAEKRYIQLPAQLQSTMPKLLVWGEGDPFQTIDYAERYAREIPETMLVRIKSAGHIAMENDPKAVAGALAEFFAAGR
jgi:pimeloyl-ACP methyl ester carboxylesterase